MLMGSDSWGHSLWEIISPNLFISLQIILITVSVGLNLQFHFFKDYILMVNNYQNQSKLNKGSYMFANALWAENNTSMEGCSV